MNKTLYISGPITNTPGYRVAFQAAEEAIAARGDYPVNPTKIRACVGGHCIPGQRNNMPKEHSWSCYMRNDLRELLDCDGIYLLKGWQGSHGAKLEFQVAIACGLSFEFQE